MTDRPLPVDARVEIAVSGDGHAAERTVIERLLPAGAVDLAVAQADDLPADYRSYAVTLKAGGLRASRNLGVEIAHAARQGPAPRDLAGRIAEALDHVAARAEPDSVRALARLALGQQGAETEAMLAAGLGPIEDCHDCADFILVPMLWCRMCYPDRLSAAIRARIDDVALGYRYWMDEPGNDVQWYFSENHALLFHTAAYLAGHLLPDGRFRRSGRTGRGQSAVGAARVAPGSTISRPARWRSSTPRRISRST